jgi:hypothetical protein
MGLYEQWQEQGNKLTGEQANLYWGAYLEAEKEAYRRILDQKLLLLKGTVSELADKFELTKVQMAGFIDGINTSLKNEISLENLEADTEIVMEIDPEKLYENMLDAKAEWLYNLDEWDNLLSLERKKEIKNAYNKSRIAVSTKIGRNEPCPCGSGLKYKKCCLLKN